VAQAFDVEEPAIGGKADLAQLGEVVETLADPEVIGVVDRVSVRRARFSL
jgi:hypothetical protein